MNHSDVTKSVLRRLAGELDSLTPEARKAARFVLENPRDIAVSTMREIALAAHVKPNTLVRMARQLGFDGYEEFREPFREAVRQGLATSPDRAIWLQNIRSAGGLGDLYSDIVISYLNDIEDTFSAISEAELRRAALAIFQSQTVYTLGMGANSAIALNFNYHASAALARCHALPQLGSTAAESIASASSNDTLIVISSEPYRRDVLQAAQIAADRQVNIIAVSDSPVAPILDMADHKFLVAVDTPRFFESSVALSAILETLLSFVFRLGAPQTTSMVKQRQTQRRSLGIYEDD